MTIQRKSITIENLVKGFIDLGEEGVFSMENKLEIRPSFQREFVYSEKQQQLVIDSIAEGCPIGVMYWIKNKRGESDFQFSCFDGQQRTLSICNFCNDKFTYKDKYWKNFSEDFKRKFLDYTIDVYMILDGTTEERMKWFERINVAGKAVNQQELRNAVYAGPFVSDARLKFSKTNCVASKVSAGYVSGTPINQDLLETAMEWKAEQEGKKNLEEYMADHQWDENCNELWSYYQKVIGWAKNLFESNGLTNKQNWGELYESHKDTRYSKNVLAAQISDLVQDDDVTKQSGIIPYVLAGCTRDVEKYLNIRTFTENQKRKKLMEQEGKCAICGKTIDLKNAEGDHIDPWHEGGKTVYENLQVLCKECNRRKSGS